MINSLSEGGRLYPSSFLLLFMRYLIVIILSFSFSLSFSQGYFNNWKGSGTSNSFIGYPSFEFRNNDSLYVSFNAFNQSFNNYNSTISFSDESGNFLIVSRRISSTISGNPFNGFCFLDSLGNYILQNEYFASSPSSYYDQYMFPMPNHDSVYMHVGYSNKDTLNNNYRSYFYSLIGYDNAGQLTVQQNDTPFFTNNYFTEFSSLTVVRHANQQDFWVVVYDNLTGEPQAFLLDSNGLSSTAVTSPNIFPPSHHIQPCGLCSFALHWEGESITSSNGAFVGFTYESNLLYNQSIVKPLVLAPFDPGSGQFPSSLAIDPPSSSPHFNNAPIAPIALEFSPNSKKMYVSWFGLGLYQYDITNPTKAAIENSAVVIADSIRGFADLQLGPDQSIYTTRTEVDALGNEFNIIGKIDYPNSNGVLCQFSDSLFNSPYSAVTGGANIFLKNFPKYPSFLFYEPVIEHSSDTCFGDTVDFALDDTTYIDSIYWDFGNGDTSYAMAPSYSYTAPGTYPIMCIYHKNIVTDTVYDTLSILPIPTADLGPDTSMCEGDTFNFPTNYGLMDVLWSTGSTDSVLTATYADTFWLEVQNACGIASDTVVIDSVFNALVNFGPDTLLCPNDTVELDATIDQGTYLWHDGSTDSTFSVTQSGTYHVAATNACGVGTDTLQVTYTVPPQEDLGPDTVACVGDSVLLTGQSAYSTFEWNTSVGSFTQDSLWIHQTDTVLLTATNTCGTDHDTLALEFILPPNTALGSDTIICYGDTIMLDATDSHADYNWNVINNLPQVPAFLTGQYAVTVTNVCGSDSDQINIYVDSLAQPNLGPDTAICQGAGITFNVQDTLSTYEWDNGGTSFISFINQTGTRWVGITNACGTVYDTIEVRVDQPHNIYLGNDTLVCPGDSFLLNPNTPGEYLWNNTTTDSAIWVNEPDTFTVAFENGCGTSQDTLVVHPEFVPSTYLGSDVYLCVGDTLDLDATFSRASYQWNTGDTTGMISVNTTDDYWVIVTNVCGGDDDTVEVWFDTLPQIDLGPNQEICEDDSIELSVEGRHAKFNWNTSDTTKSITVSEEGLYWVEMKHACDTVRKYMYLSTQSAPTVNLPQDTAFCVGESITLTPQLTGKTDQKGWLDGYPNKKRTIDQTGTYSYVVSNSCGADTATTSVRVAQPPTLELTIDTLFCNQGFYLSPTRDSGVVRYAWSTGSTSREIYIEAPGSYALTGYSIDNCIAKDRIEINQCEVPIYIPNSFTPNSDGVNETFQPINLPQNPLEYRFEIYNRWGEMIFQTEDITQGWSGENATIGSYTYRLYIRTTDQLIQKTGKVILVR